MSGVEDGMGCMFGNQCLLSFNHCYFVTFIYCEHRERLDLESMFSSFRKSQEEKTATPTSFDINDPRWQHKTFDWGMTQIEELKVSKFNRGGVGCICLGKRYTSVCNTEQVLVCKQYTSNDTSSLIIYVLKSQEPSPSLLLT